MCGWVVLVVKDAYVSTYIHQESRSHLLHKTSRLRLHRTYRACWWLGSWPLVAGLLAAGRRCYVASVAARLSAFVHAVTPHCAHACDGACYRTVALWESVLPGAPLTGHCGQI